MVLVYPVRLPNNPLVSLLPLIPVTAWVLLVFVWSFVFGRYRHGTGNRTFLVLSACPTMWVFLELLFYFPALRGHEDIILNGIVFFWIPVGFLFLVFAYNLTGRKVDWIWILSAIATTAGVALDVTTDWFLDGYTRYSWGVADVRDPLNHTLLCAVPVLSSLWGLWLVFRARMSTEDPERRKPFTLLLVGGLASLGGTMLLNIVIPNILGMVYFPRFGSSALAVFVFVVFLAVLRHDFLNVTLEKVADELFDDARAGIVLVGPDGIVTRMNRAAVDMTGRREGEPAGFPVEEILPGYSMMGVEQSVEIEMLGLKGRRVFEVSKSVRKRKEMVIGSVALFREVTGERMAKEVLERSRDDLEEEVRKRTMELRQAQKLEAMGALAGGIAHDFNNLLAAIIGFSNTALDDLPSGHPARKDLGEVQEATDQARDIVKQMLDFSRYDLPAREVVDVGEVFLEVADLLSHSIPVSIGLTAERGEGPMDVLADRGEIKQVLLNLATNAYQAIGAGKARIEMRCETVEIGSAFASEHKLPWTGPHVHLSVVDTGPGMDPDVLERVFEPFFTTRRAGHGTGLGLATVRRIVDDNEGAIAVSSEPGRGTMFDVYLPAASAIPGGEAAS